MAFQKTINEKVYSIIGSLMEVHKSLGPGYPVDFYKRALEIEFAQREHEFEVDKVFDILFKDALVGKLTVDFIVDESVVITLIVEDVIKDTEVQRVLRSLPFVGVTMGIVANFGGTKIQYKRVMPSSKRPDARKTSRTSLYRDHGRTRESNPII